MTLLSFSKCNQFLKKLNSLDSFFVYTHKKEINKSLSFLDVLFKKYNKKFITLVYRKKPTFTGEYTRLNSFGPRNRKINVIGILVHRALEICSPKKFSNEVKKSKLVCNRMDTRSS